MEVININFNQTEVIKEYYQAMEILNKQKSLAQYINIGKKLIEDNYLEEAKKLFEQIQLVYPKSKIAPYMEKINLLEKSEQKNYLFVSGTARSGTTALWRLLNLSDEILLGMERYLDQKYFDGQRFLRPHLFTFDKFFNENDQGYQKRPKVYEPLKDKYQDCRYIGDKIPGFLFGWEKSQKFFEGKSVFIIHIMRDIYDIAWSFSERAEAKKNNYKKGKGWSVDRDYKTAIYEFNKNNQILVHLSQSNQLNKNWLIIKYEDIYNSQDLMINLFKWLDIEVTQQLREKIEIFANESSKIVEKERHLNKEQISYIEDNLDQEALNIIDPICRKHLQLLKQLNY